MGSDHETTSGSQHRHSTGTSCNIHHEGQIENIFKQTNPFLELIHVQEFVERCMKPFLYKQYHDCDFRVYRMCVLFMCMLEF